MDSLTPRKSAKMAPTFTGIKLHTIIRIQKKSSPKRIQIMLLIANVKQARFCYWSYLPSHGVGQVQRTGYDQESLVTQYSIHYPVNSFIWVQDRHEPAQEINVIDNCKYFS